MLLPKPFNTRLTAGTTTEEQVMVIPTGWMARLRRLVAVDHS
jgi:hypothetical protein